MEYNIKALITCSRISIFISFLGGSANENCLHDLLRHSDHLLRFVVFQQMLLKLREDNSNFLQDRRCVFWGF